MTKSTSRTYNEIAVGDTASFSLVVTPEFIDSFAALSGDMNPLHMDDAYASETLFGKRIAHGMIAGALFSRLIGMQLPGTYSLYLSQTLRFHAPIPLGMEITVRGTVTHKTDSHKTISITTEIEDTASKKIMTSGEAMVQLLR